MQIEVPAQFCAKFRESANRPHLLMGCEPTALMAALVLCVVIGYSLPTLAGVISEILLFFGLRHGLRMMAGQDPILIQVHFQSQRCNQGFCPAGIGAEERSRD